MARNKPQLVEIDFETGESIIDPLGELRQMQAKLYAIDNPYVGNKRGILVDIAMALQSNDVHFDSVFDVFSGSAVVSTFFKMMCKKVTSNDLLTSSYYNALAFCENDSISLSKADIDALCQPNKDRGDFIRKNYAHRFTDEEALFLDNYRANVRSMESASKDGEIRKALANLAIMHYVLNRCFLGGRLNKGQVLADLDHRIAHDRNRGHELKFNVQPVPSFFSGVADCKAYNADALDAIEQARKDRGRIDLAYIDPPYGGSQSDYTQMFSFCEEFVHGDKIENLTHLQASKKFVTKKDYENHFRQVLSALSWIPTWAISYNASSFRDIDSIQKIISDYKKDVALVNIDHEYRYRKDRGGATEYLIIAR